MMQRIIKDLTKHIQLANGAIVLQTNSKIWN